MLDRPSRFISISFLFYISSKWQWRSCRPLICLTVVFLVCFRFSASYEDRNGRIGGRDDASSSSRVFMSGVVSPGDIDVEKGALAQASGIGRMTSRGMGSVSTTRGRRSHVLLHALSLSLPPSLACMISPTSTIPLQIRFAYSGTRKRPGARRRRAGKAAPIFPAFPQCPLPFLAPPPRPHAVPRLVTK
jgi:hypothetical protein